MGYGNSAVTVFGSAILGRRADQEDAFRTRWLESEQAWLLVVADGMGGHAAGALASKIAVDAFVADFVASRRTVQDLGQAFQHALKDTNARIARAQDANSQLAGMGTTLAAAHISQSGLAWISVGDSPTWVYRSGALSRINADHSLRQLDGAQARGIANMLQSALTGQPIPMIDCHPEPIPLFAGDLILIGSDGVLTLSEGAIAQIMNEYAKREPQVLAQALLRAVEQQQKSNQDNCTVIVASVQKKRRFPIFSHQTNLLLA